MDKVTAVLLIPHEMRTERERQRLSLFLFKGHDFQKLGLPLLGVCWRSLGMTGDPPAPPRAAHMLTSRGNTSCAIHNSGSLCMMLFTEKMLLFRLFLSTKPT